MTGIKSNYNEKVSSKFSVLVVLFANIDHIEASGLTGFC